MKLEKRVTEITTDVLVIGAGMAATMSALEASRHKLAVVLVDKGRLGYSGTSPLSGGGGNDWVLLPPEFGGDPRDSHEEQLKDCVIGGDYLNNQEMTEIYNQECLERFVEMEGYGVRYTRKSDGKYAASRLMGCSYARGAGRAVGGSMAMMRTMREQVLSGGIRVLENIMLTRLLMCDGRVTGAFGLDCRTGELHAFKAKAAILAAGSATGLYKYPTCPNVLTGDAYYLAYEAGVPLMNMEFLQFSITSKINDVHVRGGAGIKPMITLGARWVNSAGERIIERYDPLNLERAGWWKHVYAVYKENEEGRGPVYLDLSSVSEEKKAAQFEYDYGIFFVMKRLGLDPRRDRVEIIPGLHTFLGGAMINSRAETALPGLYAAGESAGQGGIFGADRTGGGIAAAQVVGHRAGKYAALFCREADEPVLRQAELEEERERIASFLKEKGEDPYDLQGRINDIALASLGISRTGRELEKAVAGFSQIRKEGLKAMRAANLLELVKALEVHNLALAGEMVSRAALLRTESRGQHRRADYPVRDDREWLKWITVSKRDEEMTLKTIPVPLENYKVKPPGYAKI